MKVDLRFERTEEAIQKAFLDLLQDKELPKISVKELCQKAQISRNAFYQHYESKEHLYESILQELLFSMEKACTPIIKDLGTITEAESRLFLNNILHAVHQNRFVIYQLLSSQPASFTFAFQNMLISAMHEGSRQINSQPKNPFIPIFAAGVVAFVSYWLLESSYSLVEAQDMLYEILGQVNAV